MPRAAALLLLTTVTVIGCSGDPASLPPTPTTHTAAPVISAAKLTTPWGCGYGFHVSDTGQTVALMVEWSSDLRGDPATSIAPSGPLSGGDWTAGLNLGHDLFANWCNDVIDPSTPEAVVDESLEVVEGTLTLDGDLPEQGEVTAHLTGVVARRADGSTVELGDLDVSNPCWGCFAG